MTFHLFQEDCVGGLKRLKAGSIDCMVTSPPYNLGIPYHTYRDSQPRAEYLQWCTEWGKACYRVLSESGSLFLNVGGSPSDPLIPFQVLAAMFEGGWHLQNTIHWIKSIAIGEKTHGHFKPIRSDRFLNDCHEFIFHLTPTRKTPLERTAIGVPYEDKSNIERWNGVVGDRRCRGNCWYIPYETITSREKDRPHPATFPVELPELCFRLHGVGKIHWACDPFLGIGASACAAQKLGLSFIGFEIDEHYMAVAKERLNRV